MRDNFVGVITQVNAVVHGTYRTQYIIDIWDTEKSPILKQSMTPGHLSKRQSILSRDKLAQIDRSDSPTPSCRWK